jgi:sulfite reductase beta subunit-like hemoprotein
MIRVRLPGGTATPEQWIAMDDISNNYANQTLKDRIKYRLINFLHRCF